MKKVKALFLIILIVAVLITAAYPAHAFDKDILISDYVEEFSLKTKCSAVSVAIVQDGGSELIGDADGLYQIGSLTKAFTGLGIQKLIGGGIINEDDKVSKWLAYKNRQYRFFVLPIFYHQFILAGQLQQSLHLHSHLFLCKEI